MSNRITMGMANAGDSTQSRGSEKIGKMSTNQWFTNPYTG